jgi:hypothetical protein
VCVCVCVCVFNFDMHKWPNLCHVRIEVWYAQVVQSGYVCAQLCYMSVCVCVLNCAT